MPERRLSPAALSRFLGCEHRTYLDLLRERGDLEIAPLRPDIELVLERGRRHEQTFLETLQAQHRDVVSLPVDVPVSLRAEITLEAIHAGREVLHQACLVQDGWVGYADFLIRLDEPSDLGDWSYEVHDAKLGSHARPRHIFQLLFYNEQIARIQGRQPSRIHLVLGNGEHPAFPPDEFEAYANRVRARFLQRRDELDEPEPDVAYPYPVEDCDFCPWWLHCSDRRRRDDHLSLVANLQRAQGLKLEQQQVRSVADLAGLAPERTIPRLPAVTLRKLRAQADLQMRSRDLEVPLYELLQPEPDRGLARLPELSAGDVFFDFEGDPWWGDDGLEYLFGTVSQSDGAWTYEARWATTRAEEKRQFEAWMDWITARLAEHPGLHIFHYNSYEPTALKKLMARHATRVLEVDDLLRRKVFVDLFALVRQAARIGTESYGLKALEPVIGYVRQAELHSAPGSLRRWQEFQDTEEPHLLAEISAYNEDDCRATLALRNWLSALRPEAEAQFQVALNALLPEPGRPPTDKQLRYRERLERVREELMPGLPDDESRDDVDQRARRLAFDLVGYHEREAKPEFWDLFARGERSIDELRDEDSEAISDLTPVPGTDREDTGKSWRWQLTFPEQEFKLREGEVWDPEADWSATIEALDPDRRTLTVRRSKAKGGTDAPSRLIPGMPIPTAAQVDALFRFAERVAQSGVDPHRSFDAATDLLLRRAPRFVANTPPLTEGHIEIEKLSAQVAGLDRSALVVQGPPGSGKTHTGAATAVDLMQRGLRVGIMATSHKAIINFIEKVDAHARERRFRFRGWKRAHADADNNYNSETITSAKSLPKGPEPHLIAATAWWWARADEFERIDVLFIDEAGQVSLADAIAVSQGAKSVVLLGDPQQLAHVSRGTHLHGSGASVLQHLLGDEQTVAPGRGVFLDQSWRMHPDVCRFVSDTMYEGRLASMESCATQVVSSPGFSGAGLRLLPVAHTENRQRSSEEGAAVAREVDRLLDGGRYTDRDGETRDLQLEDILIVAPYNAQVRTLKRMLPAEARVGTVDKFQGQEAPVVFFSMTSSSGEDVPRGMDFLFSRNRLNVAVSRAQSLAIVVCSPELMSTRCLTVGQMQLVNMLCRFADSATLPL